MAADPLEGFDVEALLGRPEVRFDLEGAYRLLRGKRVMVTGAGGSIGAHLCTRIIDAGPAELLAIDRSEQNAYQLDERLGRECNGTRITVALADVAQLPRMGRLFSDHKPDVVFHAAAYKHVRYVEENPEDGILNNVLATRTTAQLALESGSSRFVLISSDKAAEPTSVMGATKRLCELVVMQLSESGATEFGAVRFGNVLFSRGSVIPKFLSQIERGEPLTVHPQAERYFMSIEEAVGLVLHGAAVGGNGRICIQRMGDPVRIAEIVSRLLQQRGIPADRATIEPAELFPGEKLCERLTTEAEARTAVAVGHLLVCPRPPEMPDVQDLDALIAAAQDGQIEEISRLLCEMLPNYRPSRLLRVDL